MSAPVDSLLRRWHADAENLRSWGAEATAQVVDRCAAELEDTLATQDAEALSLAEAAKESGYCVSHLRRLIAEGKLRDVAEKGQSRVRRGDLPRKPGHHPTPTSVLRLG